MTKPRICIFSLVTIGILVGSYAGIELLNRSNSLEQLSDRLPNNDSMMIGSVALHQKSYDEQKKDIKPAKLSDEVVLLSPSSTESSNFVDNRATGTTEETTRARHNPFGNLADNNLNVMEAGRARTENGNNPFARQAYTENSQNGLNGALSDSVSESESGEIATITFTHTPLPDVHHVLFPTIVGPTESIYAHLLIATHCNNCMVRLQHYSSQEISTLKIIDLKAEKLKTVFITPDDGWISGEYILELHDPDRKKHLVGRNSMLVSNVTPENQMNIPNTEYIDHLIANGLASPKQR